ncbi:hypothetical protein [Nocardioides sp.]|uniref:hypothetical protein n=1 Tax=Nocardioides sp. TaxID=35761 RepID=UPI003784B722
MRARSSVGRLVGLAMILAGLGTATVATPPEAAAASTRPTAIGLAPSGTTYVGFATGGVLQRVNAAGHRQGGVRLDRVDPVDGLFVNQSGDIWVDYGTSVSLLTPGGRVLRHFAHDPVVTCSSTAVPTRYGGITVADGRVFVANRCTSTLSVYSTGGALLATVRLSGRPRGVAYGVAQSGRPAFVYVAVPDRGQVLAFRADTLRNSSQPASRYTLKRPRGGLRPAPGGVVVDRHGQLTVTDMANNALYLVNTNYKYSLYRTLGHPPHGSSKVGRLRAPGALAQHTQDGGGLSGNYFVLDTNNSRVQRWSTGGYSYWGRTVYPGNGGGGGTGDGPNNEALPSITGTPEVGNTLTCHRGSWQTSGGTISYSYSWRRDGSPISGATRSTYLVVDADEGARLTCRVTAVDLNGSTWATSEGVDVGGGGSGPTNSEPPFITGAPAVGSTLTCNKGTWNGGGGPSGSISYSYAWRRDGAGIGATSATYVVTSADRGHQLTCLVTGANGSGSRTIESDPVTVPGDGPSNTTAPWISGTPEPGQVLTCNPGGWSGTGTISYSYVWRRNGTAVGAGSTYSVVGGDVGASFVCTVTATDDTGSTPVPTAAVTITSPSGEAPTAGATLPKITGTPAVGQTLTCVNGSWNGSPTSFAYSWRRNSTVLGSTSTTYVVQAGDVGAALRCTVVASNSYGTATATSAPVDVLDASPPSNNTPPSLSGPGTVGTALTCDKGSWSGQNLVYHYSWRRDGTPIADTDDSRYVVLSDDQGSTLTCQVTARNTAGSVSVPSTGKTVPAAPGGAPDVLTLPSITGTSGEGLQLTCDVGSWSGAPTGYAVVWQRDGVTIATGITYTQTSADTDHALRCLVVASNAAGRGAARSPARGSVPCGETTGVVINGGAAETTSPEVELTITPPPGARWFTISNNETMAGGQTFDVSVGCTIYPWQMDSIPGLPLSWSVYVTFDNDEHTYHDDIVIRQPARMRLW